MAEVHGKNAVFKVQDAGGTLRDLSAYIKTDGLSREADLPDVTTHGNNSKRYVPGLFDGTVPLEGVWDATLDGYLAGILNVARNWEYHPAGTAAGTPKYSGSGILQSYEQEASIDDVVTFSGEFQLSGDVTRALNP